MPWGSLWRKVVSLGKTGEKTALRTVGGEIRMSWMDQEMRWGDRWRGDPVTQSLGGEGLAPSGSSRNGKESW